VNRYGPYDTVSSASSVVVYVSLPFDFFKESKRTLGFLALWMKALRHMRVYCKHHHDLSFSFPGFII